MDKLRFVVNSYIEMVLEGDKPVIYIAGKPVAYCSFLVVSLPESEANEITSIDELSERRGAKVLEGKGKLAQYGISVEENFWGHCSSIQNWAENAYNTNMIASNLSFPLLKELTRAGDPVALRVVQWEIEDRLKSGFENTMITIIEACADIMSDDAWKIVVSSSHRRVKFFAANNVHLPQFLMKLLARDPDLDVKEFLADNKKLTDDVMEILSKDRHLSIRATIAIRTRNKSILRTLASDESQNVRLNVAQNFFTGPELLSILSTDKDFQVRAAVAGHRDTPECVLAVLASDRDKDVRASVLNNANIPERALVTLMNDEELGIRRLARYTYTYMIARKF